MPAFMPCIRLNNNQKLQLKASGEKLEICEDNPSANILNVKRFYLFTCIIILEYYYDDEFLEIFFPYFTESSCRVQVA